MEQTDQLLLDQLQGTFPLTLRPYRALAESVGVSEEDALRRIRGMRQAGLIRRIGGIMNSRSLGYFSTLCAAKVPPEKIDRLAERLNQLPGVTHNYLRAHAYNMWFTLIAPSQSRAEEILTDLRAQSGVDEIFSLPALRLFKLYVRFNLSGDAQLSPPPAP
ncbi:MAG: Lrp/AsnC family transcriptional regulator, partial [Peptococcaceae bacterium]|nr:Lrp/AsnC family transcriptional regulator [Peptococcaceae bacterium]